MVNLIVGATRTPVEGSVANVFVGFGLAASRVQDVR